MDLQASRFCDREKIWGILILEENIQQSAETRLTLKEETASKYQHLQNHPGVLALEQAMYDNYRNIKLTVIGGDEPLTDRRNRGDLENAHPEP